MLTQSTLLDQMSPNNNLRWCTITYGFELFPRKRSHKYSKRQDTPERNSGCTRSRFPGTKYVRSSRQAINTILRTTGSVLQFRCRFSYEKGWPKLLSHNAHFSYLTRPLLSIASQKHQYGDSIHPRADHWMSFVFNSSNLFRHFTSLLCPEIFLGGFNVMVLLRKIDNHNDSFVQATTATRSNLHALSKAHISRLFVLVVNLRAPLSFKFNQRLSSWKLRISIHQTSWLTNPV